eukprot:SAG31_NODE_21841_length_539_cov_1.397727_1_plen_179_part_11
MQATTDASGVWRQRLPPQPPSFKPTSIFFVASTGERANLTSVLFGEVHLCSGQCKCKPNDIACLVMVLCCCCCCCSPSRICRSLRPSTWTCACTANMEYTPLSFVPRKGCIMNNASAEIASAAALGDKIRLFTVNPFGCPESQPRCEPAPQRQLESVELRWQRASTKAFKATRFSTFSA